MLVLWLFVAVGVPTACAQRRRADTEYTSPRSLEARFLKVSIDSNMTQALKYLEKKSSVPITESSKHKTSSVGKVLLAMCLEQK